jgi:uncharacterized membrane protein
MPLFNPVQKSSDDRRTPNWRQTLWLLCGGLVLAVGSCAGAFAIFSVGFGRKSYVFELIWWALMAVFAISALVSLVGIVFLVIMAIRALVNSARRERGGGLSGDA